MEPESEGGSSGESKGFSKGMELFRSRLRFHAQMAPSLPPEYLRSCQHSVWKDPTFPQQPVGSSCQLTEAIARYPRQVHSLLIYGRLESLQEVGLFDL